MRKRLIVIAGPTAVGKTTLAIMLAKHFGTEIISADSRQFFREMNIGTAKPSVAELKMVKHHLVNSLSVNDEYNAGQFEEDALKILEEIFSTRDSAVLCGGSGLYIDLVCKGSDLLPQKDAKLRSELTKLYKESGLGSLQEKLLELDPEFYHQTDLQNPQRMIRALEVCIQTGKKYSELRRGEKSTRDFKIIKIGLEDEREKVYQRINQRVDEMMRSGLLEEAIKLYQYRHLNALQTVGYKELFDHLDKKTTLYEAVALIKQHSRNYAKRQWTWFRKDKEIHWFKPGEYESVIRFIQTDLANYA